MLSIVISLFEKTSSMNIYLEFFPQTYELIAITELLENWQILNKYFER